MKLVQVKMNLILNLLRNEINCIHEEISDREN